MDLSAIDTTKPRPILKHNKYNAHALVTDNIRDTIIDAIRQEFSNEPNCDGDPFGEKRWGFDPTKFCNAVQPWPFNFIGSDAPTASAVKVSDGDDFRYCTKYKVTIMLQETRDSSKYLQSPFTDALQEKVERALKVAAKQWSARFFVSQRGGYLYSPDDAKSSVTQNDTVSIPIITFDFTFVYSTFSGNPEVPDEKIFWDAYCRKAMVERRICGVQLSKHELCATDFGREFPLRPNSSRSPVVRISGINYEFPNYKAVVEYTRGKKAGTKTDVKCETIEQALYEEDFEDKALLAVDKSRDEEALFYENKQVIQDELDDFGIDISYKEMFEAFGTSYVLTEIFPRARINIFGAVCCDEDSPDFGHRLRFGWELIDLIAESRSAD